MEIGLGAITWIGITEVMPKVLILVLVEIGLGAAAVSEANEPQVLNVLILVLVEIGLGECVQKVVHHQ